MKPSVSAIVFIAVWFGLQPLLTAETIYTWVDKNGTKRFSNESPPEGVEHYKKIETQTQPSARRSNNREQRKSYTRMMKNIKRDSKRNTRTQLAEEARKKRTAEIEGQRKIDVERQRLIQQLEAARKMRLGSSSRRRKRRNAINRAQKQLDQFNNSPTDYFKDGTQ